jgi:hypothetical protein
MALENESKWILNVNKWSWCRQTEINRKQTSTLKHKIKLDVIFHEKYKSNKSLRDFNIPQNEVRNTTCIKNCKRPQTFKQLQEVVGNTLEHKV